jgi:hypothetical protein
MLTCAYGSTLLHTTASSVHRSWPTFTPILQVCSLTYKMVWMWYALKTKISLGFLWVYNEWGHLINYTVEIRITRWTRPTKGESTKQRRERLGTETRTALTGKQLRLKFLHKNIGIRFSCWNYWLIKRMLEVLWYGTPKIQHYKHKTSHGHDSDPLHPCSASQQCFNIHIAVIWSSTSLSPRLLHYNSHFVFLPLQKPCIHYYLWKLHVQPSISLF